MLHPSEIQAILNSISEAILLIDRDGIIRASNSRIEVLMGLSGRALLGQSLMALNGQSEGLIAKRLGFAEDDLRLLLHQLASGVWSDKNTRVEYELLTPHSRFLRRAQTPVWDEDGQLNGLVMVFTDETEAHELQHIQDEITSMIVHDLRSPLTAVTASLRLLRDIADPNDSLGGVVLQTTDIAGRAVRKLLNMVNSMLDVSRLESGLAALDRESKNIGHLIEAVVDELKPLATEMDVHLNVSVPARLPALDIDAEKIERVLYNLVDNAIKFTPAEGQVSVVVSPISDGLAPPGFLRLEVHDDGPGIPDEYKNRLFDRFQQLEGAYSRRRGTGLGLTFCKLAIQAHGGSIWVEDRPEGGSAFVFTLPLSEY